MKQAYFTSLGNGYAQHSTKPSTKQAARMDSTISSLGHTANNSRPQPLAMSEGLSTSLLQELSAHLEKVVGGDPKGPRRHPVSLAYVQMNGSGRILRHSGPAPAQGELPAHRFTHVLLDIPPTLDAQQAIMTWGSRQWQRTAVKVSGRLPDPLFPPNSAELTDDAFLRFVNSPGQLELFRFVLAAYLSTPETTRIFVVATDDVVAKCIYGLTRVLPATMMEQLTFSTYEPEPLSCSARIIGTLPASEENDLPTACYADGSVAINMLTGAKSPLNMNVSYVNFVIKQLASGSLTHLDEFLGRCRMLWMVQQMAQ